MKILGYSERGAINALLFEIAFSNDSGRLLRLLLERAMFPTDERPIGEIDAVTALIEQSLSEFGDADAILLLDQQLRKSAVFVEGKVKSSQKSKWSLDEQFAKFQRGLSSKVSSSNLFTQLYHKVRFVEAAQCDDQMPLHKGLPFPRCSSQPLRKIGKNPVVLSALRKITPYVGDVFYLAIVPDSRQKVHRFVERVLTPFSHDELEGWDVSRWGFLCWSDVYEFCAAERLVLTTEVLEFNQGQIY